MKTFLIILSACFAFGAAAGYGYPQPYGYEPYGQAYQQPYYPSDQYYPQGYNPEYNPQSYQYSESYSHYAQPNDPYNPYAYLKSGGYGQQTSGHSSGGYGQQTSGHSSGGYGQQTSGHSSGGYGQNIQYVPVVKKSKKKQKIISIDKGLHIAGGSQAFGKFKSLKSCMKACASAPTCFAGDYNPWLGKCYFHSNTTACNTMSAHSKLTHFKKIPCTVPDTTNFLVTLGAQLHGGIFQKGATSLASCLKKCANAGTGIATAPTDLTSNFRGGQICFGIDYDFSSHKCFFHTGLLQRPADNSLPLCPTAAAATTVLTPIDLSANPAVVNILLCPPTGT